MTTGTHDDGTTMADARRWQDGPSRVRALVAIGGLIILLVLAAILWVRRVDPVEVTATLLFIPLFLAVLLWRLTGGIVAALLAIGAYTALRWPGISTVGVDPYLGVLVGRGLGYLAFGIIGGWAVARLQRSLTKLDLYDQIDDATGLFNARYLVDGIELERSRAQRYQTLFSVVELDVPSTAFDGVSARQQRRILRRLGGYVQNSIRTVDRAVHVVDGQRHRVVLLLPETPTEGAAVFATRFRQGFVGAMSELGATVTEEQATVVSATFPGDEERVNKLREEAARLVE